MCVITTLNREIRLVNTVHRGAQRRSSGFIKRWKTLPAPFKISPLFSFHQGHERIQNKSTEVEEATSNDDDSREAGGQSVQMINAEGNKKHYCLCTNETSRGLRLRHISDMHNYESRASLGSRVAVHHVNEIVNEEYTSLSHCGRGARPYWMSVFQS